MGWGRLWNEFYKNNDERIFTTSQPPDLHIEDFLNLHNFDHNIKILDSGCGGGKNTQLISYRFKNTYGVDISEHAIIDAKKNLPEVNFSVQDVRELNFDNEFFDVVIDAGCMHVEHPKYNRKIAEEYHRILKPNGNFFIRLFYREEDKIIEQPIFFFDAETKQMPVYGYRHEDIVKLFDGLFKGFSYPTDHKGTYFLDMRKI